MSFLFIIIMIVVWAVENIQFTFVILKSVWLCKLYINMIIEIVCQQIFVTGRYNIVDLLPSTQYNFQVAAHNDMGTSPACRSVGFTTLASAPEAPHLLCSAPLLQPVCAFDGELQPVTMGSQLLGKALVLYPTPFPHQQQPCTLCNMLLVTSLSVHQCSVLQKIRHFLWIHGFFCACEVLAFSMSLILVDELQIFVHCNSFLKVDAHQHTLWQGHGLQCMFSKSDFWHVYSYKLMMDDGKGGRLQKVSNLFNALGLIFYSWLDPISVHYLLWLWKKCRKLGGSLTWHHLHPSGVWRSSHQPQGNQASSCVMLGCCCASQNSSYLLLYRCPLLLRSGLQLWMNM